MHPVLKLIPGVGNDRLDDCLNVFDGTMLNTEFTRNSGMVLTVALNNSVG